MDVWQSLMDGAEFLVGLSLLAVGYFSGRRNERQHLQSLARRERELAPVLLFATRNPPPFAAPQDPLLVCGSVALSADYFRMFVAGLRKIVGGRFHAFEALTERARREAVLRMKEEARAAGCSLIVNVRVETTAIQNGAHGGSSAVEAIAYGTALAPAAGSVGASPMHVHATAETLGDRVEPAFELMQNRASRVLIIAWFAVMGLVLAEASGLSTYQYALGAPWLVYAALAALAVVPLWRGLRRRAVPRAEAGALTVLAAGLLPFGLYFLALHANAWTDASPQAETVYRQERDGSLVAVVAGDFPVLRFPQYREYFAAQKPGYPHRFRLRRGLLGFWQLDRDDFAARLKAFYRARR